MGKRKGRNESSDGKESLRNGENESAPFGDGSSTSTSQRRSFRIGEDTVTLARHDGNDANANASPRNGFVAQLPLQSSAAYRQTSVASSTAGSTSILSSSSKPAASMGISNPITSACTGLWNFGANKQGGDDASSGKESELSSNTESLLVKELNALSIHERQRVYEDVHGVSVLTQETPEFLANVLQRLDRQLKKVKQRSAYDRAVFLSPHQVMESRLHFLRCDNFDVPKAAKRMVKYFQFRLDMFGIQNLVRPITYDDLAPDEQAFLREGTSQSLGTDQVGRPVFVTFLRQKRLVSLDWDTMARVYFYISMLTLQEFPEASKKGSVIVMYDSSDIQGFDAKDMSTLKRFHETTYLQGANTYFLSIPNRLSAVHFCYDNHLLTAPMHALQFMVGHRGRVRFRSHYGSHLENVYKLMTFGIPTKNLPITQDGTVSTVLFNHWIDGIRDKERSERRAEQQRDALALENNPGKIRIRFPEKTAIMCGRGRPFQDFPGNVALGVLVDSYYDEYQERKKSDKTRLSMELVQRLKSQGVRFLKRCPFPDPDEAPVEDSTNVAAAACHESSASHGIGGGGNHEYTSSKLGVWEIVDDERAREKVSHTFRNTTLHRNAAAKEKLAEDNARNGGDHLNTVTDVGNAAANTNDTSIHDELLSMWEPAPFSASSNPIISNDNNNIDNTTTNNNSWHAM